MVEIAGRQHHALGFARSSRGVEDCDTILRREISGESRAPLKAGWGAPNISSSNANRGASRPRRGDRFAQRRVAAANQRRRGIAQHRGQFRRRLARVHRHRDQAFGNNRQIERGPADAVRRDQGAAVAFCKSGSAQKMRGPCRFAPAVPRRSQSDCRRRALRSARRGPRTAVIEKKCFRGNSSFPVAQASACGFLAVLARTNGTPQAEACAT